MYHLTEFYILFVILQQNMDIVKTENDVDVLSEEDSIGMIIDEFHVPLALSVRKAETEVSLVFR
jgi:hypothetical protein